MDYITPYADFLKKSFNLKKPLSIVSDASNGTAGIVAKKVFNDIPNLNAVLINNEPDGDFPAHGPNPVAKGALEEPMQKVKEEHADMGVVFDADGDRAIFIDEKGRMLPAHVVGALLFKQAKAPFVADELVFMALNATGIACEPEVIPSKVGSFFIKERMRELEASVGVENSGHYYFKDFFYADSGILTAITVSNTLSTLDMTLGEYYDSLPPHAVVNGEVEVTDLRWKDVETAIRAHINGDPIIHTRDGITLDFGASWTSVRASNTEPILRIVAGAPTEVEAQSLVKEVEGIVSKL